MNDIETQIKDIIFQNLDKNEFKVFLFGSRAKGNFKKTSDYDVGIIGKNKLNFELYLKILGELNELPYKIDFVDFKRVDDSFKKIALKTIITWN